MPQTPRNVKNRMASNIFSAEKDALKNTGMLNFYNNFNSFQHAFQHLEKLESYNWLNWKKLLFIYIYKIIANTNRFKTQIDPALYNLNKPSFDIDRWSQLKPLLNVSPSLFRSFFLFLCIFTVRQGAHRFYFIGICLKCWIFSKPSFFSFVVIYHKTNWINHENNILHSSNAN